MLNTRLPPFSYFIVSVLIEVFIFVEVGGSVVLDVWPLIQLFDPKYFGFIR